MKEGQTPGPRVRVVWVTGWGPAPSTLLSPSLRSQDLGRQQRGADWKEGRGARTTAEEPHLYSTAV